MSITNVNAGNGFIPSRDKLYGRLMELVRIGVKTEAEKIEEHVLSRKFWDYGAVEASLLKLSYIHIESEDATPLQNRICRAARENRPQGYGGELCVT